MYRKFPLIKGKVTLFFLHCMQQLFIKIRISIEKSYRMERHVLYNENPKNDQITLDIFANAPWSSYYSTY